MWRGRISEYEQTCSVRAQPELFGVAVAATTVTIEASRLGILSSVLAAPTTRYRRPASSGKIGEENVLGTPHGSQVLTSSGVIHPLVQEMAKEQIQKNDARDKRDTTTLRWESLMNRIRIHFGEPRRAVFQKSLPFDVPTRFLDMDIAGNQTASMPA